MICFMDRTFCSSLACRNECGRQLTPDLIARGKKWWGSDDFPVCVGEYCDAEGNLIQHNQIEDRAGS